MEVDLGAQTQNFHPTDYVDITAVREKKKAALFAHKSQDGERIYSQPPRDHGEFSRPRIRRPGGGRFRAPGAHRSRILDLLVSCPA